MISVDKTIGNRENLIIVRMRITATTTFLNFHYHYKFDMCDNSFQK